MGRRKGQGRNRGKNGGRNTGKMKKSRLSHTADSSHNRLWPHNGGPE